MHANLTNDWRKNGKNISIYKPVLKVNKVRKKWQLHTVADIRIHRWRSLTLYACGCFVYKFLQCSQIDLYMYICMRTWLYLLSLPNIYTPIHIDIYLCTYCIAGQQYFLYTCFVEYVRKFCNILFSFSRVLIVFLQW